MGANELATLPPALERCSIREQTFLGVRLTQSWADLQLWEWVLNDNPQLAQIIEIGTWEGGMSRFLAAQAAHRELGFTTLDIVPPPVPTPGFVPLDVFEQQDAVREWMATGPVALFCDGGDKPRELATFAPAIGPEDLIAVHDWRDEVGPDDVPEGLVDVYGHLCESLGSHTRFFKAR